MIQQNITIHVNESGLYTSELAWTNSMYILKQQYVVHMYVCMSPLRLCSFAYLVPLCLQCACYHIKLLYYASSHSYDVIKHCYYFRDGVGKTE